MAAKKSLKIERKKKAKKTKKASKKRLVIKVAKLNRTVRKARSFAKKALKTAIKGADLKKIPEKLYRKIDAEIAKSADLKTVVEKAVVDAVNTTLAEKKPAKKEKVTE
jgi:hypothetical protein